ncbi:MAG: hypothetical protein K6A63_03790 [Acholeplasmatales bacterium]|nr:hypothetical protein [Acholeplasmatales bacterium]
MRKIKFLIASMFGAIALVFACVTGAKVNALTNETTYDTTHDYSISIGSLVTAYSSYGSVHSGAPQSVTNDIVAFSGNYNWYDESITAHVSPTNNTGCTFNSFTVPTGGRSVVFKVPSGQSQISVEVYLLAMNKAGSDHNYSLKTSGTLACTISSGTASNLKLDGTVATLSTIAGDSTVHKVTFNYSANVTMSVASGLAVVGIAADNVAVSGHIITYYDSDKTTALGTSSADDGETTTAIANPKAPIGKTFDKWLKVSDDKAFDFSTAITSDLSLYASYKTDPNYVVGNGYTLDSALLGALYGEGYTSKFESTTTLPDTHFAILLNTTIVEVSGTPKTYHLNTGGEGDNTKRGISITTTGAGTITFIADGNGSSRTANISKIVNSSNTVQQTYNLSKNDSTTEYTFDVEAAGTYYLYGAGTINIYYASFAATEASACTLTCGTANALSGNSSAVAFVGKIEGLTDTATVTKATFTFTNDKAVEYETTTLYGALTSGGSTFAGAEAAENTYYVYATLYGLTSTHNGRVIYVSLTVTFSDGSTLTKAFNAYQVNVA